MQLQIKDNNQPRGVVMAEFPFESIRTSLSDFAKLAIAKKLSDKQIEKEAEVRAQQAVDSFINMNN